MNEPNTEPQPPPAPPKGRHPLAWLVFLTPSVLTWLPWVWMRWKKSGEDVLGLLFVALLVATMLCFCLGPVMENWLHRDRFHRGRAFGFSCLLFVFNLILSFSGCWYGGAFQID